MACIKTQWISLKLKLQNKYKNIIYIIKINIIVFFQT